MGEHPHINKPLHINKPGFIGLGSTLSSSRLAGEQAAGLKLGLELLGEGFFRFLSLLLLQQSPGPLELRRCDRCDRFLEKGVALRIPFIPFLG